MGGPHAVTIWRGMGEVGAKLRGERERLGIGIDQIEAETHIRAKFLLALEEERFDVLPGPAYVRAFVRDYAEQLGLDPQGLMAELSTQPDLVEDVVMIAPRQVATVPLLDRRRVCVGVVPWRSAMGGGGAAGARPSSAGRWSPAFGALALPLLAIVQRRSSPRRAGCRCRRRGTSPAVAVPLHARNRGAVRRLIRVGAAWPFVCVSAGRMCYRRRLPGAPVSSRTCKPRQAVAVRHEAPTEVRARRHGLDTWPTTVGVRPLEP